jgi:flagellar biosynthesis protein FlhF
MRLKLYRAATTAEAMDLVRDEFGADALILSTRRVAQGVEITAALDQADIPELAPPANAPLPAPAATLPASANPGSPDLAFHGIPPPLAARLEGADLSAALRAVFRFGALPIATDTPPLILAGLPGAGKTLTVARLATRMVLAGMMPMVITADGRRAGAAEELAAYTRLLGIGLVVASTPQTLARALTQRVSGAPVLIDTAGINPFAEAELAELRALIGAAGATAVLVMPAGQDFAEAAEQAQAFAPLGTRHFLPTRLDLARRLGSILGAASAADLILTEAGIGAGASDGLTPLTPEFLAARLGQAPPAALHHRRPSFPRASMRIAENAKETGYVGHDYRG